MIKKQEIKSSKTVKKENKKLPKITVKTRKTSKKAVKEVLKTNSGKIKRETKLTEKQLVFCHEYLKDLNATQSCIRAGYSEKTADRIGPELLGKTCVKNKIDELKNERIKKTEITNDYVLNEYKDQYLLAKENQIYYDKNGNKRVDLTGTTKALDFFAKYLGMHTEKQEVQHIGLGDMLIQLKNKKAKLKDE